MDRTSFLDAALVAIVSITLIGLWRMYVALADAGDATGGARPTFMRTLGARIRRLLGKDK